MRMSNAICTLWACALLVSATGPAMAQSAAAQSAESWKRTPLAAHLAKVSILRAEVADLDVLVRAERARRKQNGRHSGWLLRQRAVERRLAGALAELALKRALEQDQLILDRVKRCAQGCRQSPR